MVLEKRLIDGFCDKLEYGIPRAAGLHAEIKLCVIDSDELSKLGRIVPMY